MERSCIKINLTKATYNQCRSKTLRLRVSPLELDYLAEFADEQGYKLSGLVREALQHFIDRD